MGEARRRLMNETDPSKPVMRPPAGPLVDKPALKRVVISGNCASSASRRTNARPMARSVSFRSSREGGSGHGLLLAQATGVGYGRGHLRKAIAKSRKLQGLSKLSDSPLEPIIVFLDERLLHFFLGGLAYRFLNRPPSVANIARMV